VANPGYVAIDTPHQSNVIFPSIGVNAAGKRVMSFTVVGKDFFSSVAYAKIEP
jgi:hypothetical protein